jgi:hypothetical protein
MRQNSILRPNRPQVTTSTSLASSSKHVAPSSVDTSSEKRSIRLDWASRDSAAGRSTQVLQRAWATSRASSRCDATETPLHRFLHDLNRISGVCHDQLTQGHSPASHRCGAGDEQLLKSWRNSLSSPHTRRNFETTVRHVLANSPWGCATPRSKMSAPHSKTSPAQCEPCQGWSHPRAGAWIETCLAFETGRQTTNQHTNGPNIQSDRRLAETSVSITCRIMARVDLLRI